MQREMRVAILPLLFATFFSCSALAANSAPVEKEVSTTTQKKKSTHHKSKLDVPSDNKSVTKKKPVTDIPPAPTERIPAASRRTADSDATARCKDGTLSHSKQHSGTCSRHGGVDSWIR